MKLMTSPVARILAIDEEPDKLFAPGTALAPESDLLLAVRGKRGAIRRSIEAGHFDSLRDSPGALDHEMMKCLAGITGLVGRGLGEDAR